MLAASETANLQPPQFSIEVFANPGGTAVEEWLATHAPGIGAHTPVTIGGKPGFRVQLNAQLAPNEFYFVANGQSIYKLTLLGQSAPQMLQSFSFT